jgi:hypothetical protein
VKDTAVSACQVRGESYDMFAGTCPVSKCMFCYSNQSVSVHFNVLHLLQEYI